MTWGWDLPIISLKTRNSLILGIPPYSPFSARYPSLFRFIWRVHHSQPGIPLSLSLYLKDASHSTRYPSLFRCIWRGYYSQPGIPLTFILSEGCITLNQVSLSLSLYLKGASFSTRYPSLFRCIWRVYHSQQVSFSLLFYLKGVSHRLIFW